jgi:hypothetical protein
MPTPEDKRAKIIAAQKEREEADRAAGKLPPAPNPRSNWASTPSKARRPGRPRTWKPK